MKRKIIIFLVCFLCFPTSTRAAELYTLETIKKVIKGDTFELESGKKIRLIGVDAPEIEKNREAREEARRYGYSVDQIVKMGKEAKEFVKIRLEGKDIFLKYDQQKEDGRGAEWVYAYLYDVSTFYGGITVRERIEDVQFEWFEIPQRGRWLFINPTLIKAGYATPVRNPPNLKYADLFEQSYWEGKEAFEGLFNVNFFEVPCTEEGGKIGECAGCIIRCCKDLMPMFDQVVDGKCREKPLPGTGGFCSNCGNDKCESKHLEDSCNCPEDCK